MSRDDARLQTVAPGALSALLQDLVRPDVIASSPTWVGALVPGAVIGRYELVRLLGRGGFGIVYEAKDLSTGCRVAFKAVCAGRPEVREERVLREAELATRLSHPNIVALHDVGRCEHGPYLVLELLEGETLAQRMSRAPPAIGDAMRIAGDVARAMAHAHSTGVFHRDLTPGNVFLCRDGGVKVLDFGMAHAFGRRKLEGGTPAYMAPEQRRGAPEDERTDVFALGVLLYEMLARSAPPTRHVRGSTLAIEGAPGLAELLGTMLAPDPIERPRDASELVSALDTIMADLRCDPRRPAVVTLYAPPSEQASVAVLPFADLSPARDMEHLAEGIAQEVLNALARVPRVRVAGRASSFSLKGRSCSIVGRELGVSNVLHGTVGRDAERICVTAELVSAATGARMWADRFEGALADLFRMQGEIAHRAAVSLGGDPLPAVDALGRPNPTSADAYDTYLRGHHFFVRGLHTQALEHFEAALALDRHYAPVLAGIAFAALFLQEFDRDADAATERPRQAIAAAERAVAEAPDLADGHAARGLVRAAFLHDWDGALADVDEAVALRRDADTMRTKGIVWIALGRIADAISMFREAARLDPLSPAAWNTLGAAHLAAEDVAAAKKALERAIEISPAQAYAPGNLGTALLFEGRIEEALEAWQRSTSEIVRLMGAAIVHRQLGNRPTADRALETMISRYGDQGAFRIAQVYGAWRDSTQAIDWLERARRRRSARLTMEIKSHPFLRSLRHDTRFHALLEKLDLPAP